MFIAFASSNPDAVASAELLFRQVTTDVARPSRVSRRFFVAVATSDNEQFVTSSLAVTLGTARLASASFGTDRHNACSGRLALETLSGIYHARGREGIAAMHGRFGAVFVSGDDDDRIVVVRDPLGMAPLYYKRADGGLYVSDSQDRIPRGRADDKDAIAEFIAKGGVSVDTCIWSGVRPVPPGTLATWHDGSLTFDCYWAPQMFRQRTSADPDEVADEFRNAVKRAVLDATDPAGQTWADLSGGLDSSAVVATSAVYGAAEGRSIGGTVTFIDSLGGDESRFVDAVNGAFGLKGERLVDQSPWEDDGLPPPITAHPTRDFIFYARDRRMATRLRRAGVTAVLSGIGPDAYMPFAPDHIPDLMVSGRMRDGMRQMIRWAVVTKSPLWQVAYRDVLLPWMPGSIQAWHARRTRPVPVWLRRTFVTQHGFDALWASVPRSRAGEASQTNMQKHCHRFAASLQNWRTWPDIEVRHPLLDRTLVEIGLQQPHLVRTDIGNSKPLLRNAMRGIVPKEVLRRRCTKGTLLGGRIRWALKREWPTLERLVKRSILADMGCIEPKALLSELRDLAEGRGGMLTAILPAISLETWLATRAGQYTSTVK